VIFADYFSQSIASDALAGLLIKKTGYRNSEKMATLTGELRKVSAADGKICNVQLRVYLKLAYQDLFDQSHVEYYSVESAGAASPLPASEGIKWVDHFNLVRGDAVDLDTVAAKNLWDKLSPKPSVESMATDTPATSPTANSTTAVTGTPIPTPTPTATPESTATPLSSSSSTPTEKPTPTPGRHSRPHRHHHH
jgi:hypothetical protein